jgi:hypothetical protein
VGRDGRHGGRQRAGPFLRRGSQLGWRARCTWASATRRNGDANQYAVRALYELGDFTFGGYVQRDENGFGANLGSRTTYRLSGMWTLGNTEFHANWGHAGDYNTVGDRRTSGRWA